MRNSAFVKYSRQGQSQNKDWRRGLGLVILLLVGFSIGLAITWEIFPIIELDNSPAALRADYKDDFRFLVASAYSYSGDINRARVRLALLDDPDPYQALVFQTEHELSGGSSQTRLFALSVLAEALLQPLNQTVYLTETQTIPTLSSTATPIPYVLISQEVICDPGSTQGLVQIQVQDKLGKPMPGVEVFVTSTIGQQHVYTGLKPEMGTGYVDIILQQGISYKLKVIPSNQPIGDLEIPECRARNGVTYGGGYLLVFGQP